MSTRTTGPMTTGPTATARPGSRQRAALTLVLAVLLVLDVAIPDYDVRPRVLLKASKVQVRRSGAWADAGPDVYGRHSAVWVKAQTRRSRGPGRLDRHVGRLEWVQDTKRGHLAVASHSAAEAV